MGILRFLLAISVVVFHTGKPLLGVKFSGGALAVQLFFVISGFYMSLILNEKYKKGTSTYNLFNTNRLLRLYPVYLLTGLITLAITFIDFSFFNQTENWFGIMSSHIAELNGVTLAYILLANTFIMGQDLALFLGLDVSTGALFFTKNFHNVQPEVNSFMLLGQAWTIALEIMFYLVAPFIVRRRLTSVFILLLTSLLIRLYIYYVLKMKYDPWIYRFFPTEMMYFLIGNVCYRSYKQILTYNLNKNYLVLITVFLWIYIAAYGNIFALFDGLPLYQTAFHLIYIVCFVITLPFIFILTKDSKIDSYIGELSYPIYLCQSLSIYVDQRFAINSVNFVIPFTVGLAIVLHHTVVKRIEVIRQKRAKVLTTQDDYLRYQSTVA